MFIKDGEWKMTNLEKMKYSAFAAGVATGMGLIMMALGLMVAKIFFLPCFLSMMLSCSFGKDADRYEKEIENGIAKNA
jgi:hypothetical protein